MNENYVEVLVKREGNDFVSTIGKILTVVGIGTTIVGIIFYPLFIVVGIVFALIGYFVSMESDVEYEYLYLAKELSIDKIKAKTKRKKVSTIDLQRLEVFAPESSQHVKSYEKREMKRLDFSAGKKDSQPYLLIYNGDNEVVQVRLHASAELIKAVEMVSPRKVFKD